MELKEAQQKASAVSREIKPLPAPVKLTTEQLEKLSLFKDLLLKWNKRINLIAPSSEGDVQTRHIEDALQISGLIPQGTPLLDLGSGGGLPAIPLAIALNSSLRMIESDARKCAFLREACRVCKIDAEIISERIENANISPAPVITARALASLPKLLDWCEPLLKKDGFCIFPKGENAENELTETFLKRTIKVQAFQSKTCDKASVLKITNFNEKD